MRTTVSSWLDGFSARDLAFVTALVIVLSAVLLVRHRREAGRAALVLDGVLGAYLIFLATVVFCPLPGLSGPLSFERVPVSTTVDLRGFLGGSLDNQNRQNLLLLVPFGFGLPFVVRWRGWALITACATLPLGIECLQFLISLLIDPAYRRVDLNDWVANVAGGLLGLALFADLSWALAGTRADGDPQRQVRARIARASRRFRAPGDAPQEAAHRRRTARTAAVATLTVVAAAALLRSMGPAATPDYAHGCEGTAPAGAVTLAEGYSAYTDRGLLCLTYPGGFEAVPAGAPDPTVQPETGGGVTVIGQAPAGTSRAVVTLADGRSAEAILHPIDGLDGGLVYAAELGPTKDRSGGPGAETDPSAVRVRFLGTDGAPIRADRSLEVG